MIVEAVAAAVLDTWLHGQGGGVHAEAEGGNVAYIHAVVMGAEVGPDRAGWESLQWHDQANHWP